MEVGKEWLFWVPQSKVKIICLWTCNFPISPWQCCYNQYVILYWHTLLPGVLSPNMHTPHTYAHIAYTPKESVIPQFLVFKHNRWWNMQHSLNNQKFPQFFLHLGPLNYSYSISVSKAVHVRTRGWCTEDPGSNSRSWNSKTSSILHPHLSPFLMFFPNLLTYVKWGHLTPRKSNDFLTVLKLCLACWAQNKVAIEKKNPL